MGYRHARTKGASPRTIQYSKGSVLNAIFTTALGDEIIAIHPSHGVRSARTRPGPADHHRGPVRPAVRGTARRGCPSLVETEIESGLRWGELTELRVGDLDLETRILTISRAVVELSPDDHPTGGRFLVKEFPKDKEYRRFKLSQRSPPRSTPTSPRGASPTPISSSRIHPPAGSPETALRPGGCPGRG